MGARRVSEGLHSPSRPGERRQTPGWAAEEESRELVGNKGSVCREEKTAANQQASADEYEATSVAYFSIYYEMFVSL